ncbi:replication endonuclease [Vibrio toranzoniae]|uniref:replication endonuclease n=1 Tax=Vibrio toranzoniae TaxID=1194427 RepID=UPI0013785F47|nr:replication endonuclease [Vibrio toranzoniae]NAZ92249.1 hypothetical protein [Vibrio toranzoniae]
MSNNNDEVNSIKLSNDLRIAIYEQNVYIAMEALEAMKSNNIYSAESCFNHDHKITKAIGGDLASVFKTIYRGFDSSFDEIMIETDRGIINDLESLELSLNAVNSLIRVVREFVNVDFANQIESLVLNFSGQLRKNAKEELLKFFDRKIMQRRFNAYVLSEQMTNEMKKGNVGDTESKKVKAVAQRINNNTENLHEYAPINLINKVSKERSDSQKAMKRMKIQGSDKTVFEVAKTDKHKFHEHYIEMNALVELAEERGFTWLFITTTCPPEFHSNPSHGKRCYNNASIKDTDKHLAGKWNNLRKRLTKNKYKHLAFDLDVAFGKRVKEPQKDATVHYHYILFCREDLASEYHDLFKAVFGQSDAACDVVRKGYKKDRITGEEIKLEDTEEASAASYVMKYISKGLSVDILDENGKVVELDKAHIEAWKKCGGIRAISSFGFNGVRTKYNEARKINNKSRKTIARIDKNREPFEAEVRAKAIHNVNTRMNADKNLSRQVSSNIMTVSINAFVDMANRMLIEKKVTLCNADKTQDEVEIMKIARILKLAEKVPTYCETDNEMKLKVPYKDFMMEAARLEHSKEERVNKRKTKETVNTGLRLENSKSDVKIKF